MQDGDELAPRGPISRGLRFRVAAVLALALLPIGVVGILQTRDLSQEVRIRTELTLQALPARASFGERQVIERAFGAAEALSSVLLEIRDEPESCRRYLSDYLEATGRYSFIGFLPPGGVLSCSSAPATLALSQDACCVAGAYDAGDPQLPADDGGVAGAPAMVGDDGVVLEVDRQARAVRDCGVHGGALLLGRNH